jgi:hypothetical protein
VIAVNPLRRLMDGATFRFLFHAAAIESRRAMKGSFAESSAWYWVDTPRSGYLSIGIAVTAARARLAATCKQKHERTPWRPQHLRGSGSRYAARTVASRALSIGHRYADTATRRPPTSEKALLGFQQRAAKKAGKRL